MPDVQTAGAALAAFDTLINKVKLVMGINERLKNADFSIALADLNLSLANANMELTKVINENSRLSNELKKARETIRIRPHVVRNGNVYKLAKPIKGYGEGPFCLRCFDVDGILVNLMLDGRMVECNECRRQFGNNDVILCFLI